MTQMQFKCLLWPLLVASVLRVSLWRLQQWSRDQKPLPSNKKIKYLPFSDNPLATCLMSSAFRQTTHRIIMKNQSLLSTVYASLVLSACFIQGYSLPQKTYSAAEFGRKFGGASNDISNSIDGEPATKLSAEAKEEGSLVTTVVQLALKFAPTLINLISGETGPSQTDRVDGIDLNVKEKNFLK